MAKDNGVTSEPETAQDDQEEAQTPSIDTDTTDAAAPSENDSSASGDETPDEAKARRDRKGRKAPDGFHYEDVLEGETLPQMAERLRVPVNYISGPNRESVDAHSGQLFDSPLLVREGE